SPATANASGDTRICGIVLAFSPWYNVTIGPLTIRQEPGLFIPGQSLVAPGVNICLTAKFNAFGNLTTGSSFAEAPGTLQIRIPTYTHGTENGEDTVFGLDTPLVLNVQQPIPAGVSVTPFNESIATLFSGVGGNTLQVYSSTAPNSVTRALSCNDSVWDIVFAIGTSGATEGDMVTLSLQRADGSGQIVLAMFTVQGGNLVVSQLASDVDLRSIMGRHFALGSLVPLQTTPSGELRTDSLLLVLNMGSARLMECLQFVEEIKRASGAGKTSLIV